MDATVYLSHQQVTQTALSWQRNRGFYITIIVVTIVLTISTLIYGASHIHLLNKGREKYEFVTFSNRVLTAIGNPRSAVNSEEKSLAIAIQNLAQAVQKEYPQIFGFAWYGFLSLYRQGITAQELEKIELIFKDLTLLSPPEYAYDILKGRTKKKFYNEYYLQGQIASYTLEGRSDRLYDDIWRIFPLQKESRELYLALSKISLSSPYLKKFLSEQNHEILKVLEGGDIEEALHEVPRLKEGYWAQRSFGQHILVTMLITLGAVLGSVSLWTWFVYLKETWEYPKPWHIKVNLVTSLLALFWCPPIILTIFYFFFKRIVLLLRAIITFDFGRVIAILAFKRESSSGSARQDAITLLYQRFGEAQLLLRELELRALSDSSAELKNQINSLKSEIKDLNDRIDRLIQEHAESRELSYQKFQESDKAFTEELQQIKRFLE